VQPEAHGLCFIDFLLVPGVHHRDLSGRRRQDVEQNGEVMGDGTGQDENVPDGVEVGGSVTGIEGNACSVSESADRQPDQPAGGDDFEHGLEGNDRQPPHEDVHDRGGGPESFDEKEAKDDTGQGKAPDEPEKRPAPSAAKESQRKGCVRAGDEQEDAGMIGDAQDLFEA